MIKSIYNIIEKEPEMKPSLTVLTPLYNRYQFVDRIYYCLCAQSRKDFQWLIIDDGSERRSDDKIADFSAYSEFEIDYIYKENGGKHTALNHAHPYIKGDWVLILDSDDVLTGDAVAKVSAAIEKYSENPEIGIISFQKGTDRETPGVKFDEGEVISDHIEYRINKKRFGDCCEVVRADVLREYPFPVFEGEKYMNESHLWMGSADKYDTVYIPGVIYLYEYNEDGLTKAGRKYWRTCPKGCFHSQVVSLNPRCSLSYRIKRALLMHYYGRLMGLKVKYICEAAPCPSFVRFFTLPGYILYRHWERKYKGKDTTE